jgi:hypothetical protein
VNFLLVGVLAVGIIEVAHFSPENWLVLAIAAALVSEKVHADRHQGGKATDLARARLARYRATLFSFRKMGIHQ